MSSTENTTPLPKILCVDDEPAILESLARVLRRDFSVICSEDGAKGLDQLQKNPDIKIILTDYQMPNLNGLEFLKQAQIISPTVVRCMLSGQIDLPQLSEAINQAHLHRFFLKPWDNTYLKIQLLESIQYSEMLSENSRLYHLAITDPVTQLTNHRFFQEKLSEHLANPSITSLALFMIDVDHFKSYNDHYGHPEGDRILNLISDRLRSLAPEPATVSRYGGEEFTIILPNISDSKAEAFGQSLQKTFETEPFLGPGSRPAYITISIGVALKSTIPETPQELISRADKALYRAKKLGRNQVIVFHTKT